MKPQSTFGIILLIAIVAAVGYFGYLSITDTSNPEQLKTDESTGSQANSAEDYFSKLKITFTNTVYPTDVNQSNPRLRHYIGKVQNAGDRTLSSVTIKVNYLDQNARPIKEDSILVAETLKPNFIAEFRYGGLDVPADWSGRISYEVVNLRFADEVRVYYPPAPAGPLDRSLPEILIPLNF